MIDNLSFDNFKKLPTIKDLPINEQQRQYFIYKSDIDMRRNASGSVGFSVSVYNQLVTGSVVVVGWVNGLTYRDETGSVKSLVTDDEKGIAVAITDSYGIANFKGFNPRWIVVDYSTGEPVKKYAPMYSYGGTTEGYTPLNMASNVSIRGINPLTTELSTSTPNSDFKTDTIVDQNLTYLGEWLGSSLTDEQKNLVKQGIAIPEIYQPLIEPIKQASNLFTGLGITSSAVEVEVVSGYAVTYDQKTIAAQTLAPSSAFSRYATLRSLLATQSQTKSQYLVNNPVSSEEAGKALGYNITTTTSLKAITSALFAPASSASTYQAVKTTYAATFYQKATNNETSTRALINFNTANRTSGAVQIHADGEIPSLSITLNIYNPAINLSMFTSRAEQIRIRRNATASGGTYDPATNSILEKNRNVSVGLTLVGSSDAGYIYSFNIKTAASSIEDDSIYYVVADLKDNKSQQSSKIKAPAKSTTFIDYISGELVRSDSDNLPDRLTILPSRELGNKDVILTKQAGQIGRKSYYSGSDGIKDYVVYWTGEFWRLDYDTDPTSWIANADSSSITPDGSYGRGLIFII